MSPVNVYHFKINPHPAFPLTKALNLLPDPIKNEIFWYRDAEDRIRGTVGKLMLRKALIQKGHCVQVLEYLKTDQFKRPYLNIEIDFNIAHSGSYVVLALSNTGKVGIDVEKIRPVDIQRFRSWHNQQDLQRLGNQDQLRFFFETWTQKEAVAKAVGRGIQVPFSEISIENNHAKYKDQSWFLYPIPLEKEYKSHLATSHQGEICTSKLKLDELIS